MGGEWRKLKLRLVIGRAGSGKTFFCVQEICEELRKRGDLEKTGKKGKEGEIRTLPCGEKRGRNLIFLVPEQATFQMERILVTQPGLGGMLQGQVFSFRRLAWRVLQETGGANRPYLHEAGRDMILRRLLEQRRKEMKVFQRVERQSNFTASLGQFIREMKMYGIKPQTLKEKAAELKNNNALLSSKLEDLAILYADFENFLSSRRLMDPDDYLTLLAEKLPLSDFCRGAAVWVDGFSGFTPQEYKVIGGLLAVSGEVTVTLCLNREAIEKPPGEGEVFFRTYKTLEKLQKIASSAKVNIEYHFLEEDALPRWRGKNPFLAYLEKHLFSRPFPACLNLPQKEETGIKIIAASDRLAEAEEVAREIISLARDRSYRWRDIVVLVRDLSLYGDLLEKVFGDYEIPCFIDYKRSMRHHPLVELICSALAVAVSEWNSQAVFRYLKTDFPFVSREEVDLLENYVLAHGIKGKWWLTPGEWKYWRRYSLEEENGHNGTILSHQREEELKVINEIRRRALKELLCFYEKLKGVSSVREITVALYELLQDLKVEEKLKAWAELAQQQGKVEEARQHLQLGRQLLILLEELVEALGEENLALDEYLKVLESGLDSLKIGLIPPGLDQVVVGTLDRSRSPEAKAAFILGANEGILPARLTAGGLVGDEEREILAERGLELAPHRKRALFEERYLIYWGLTRASERLYISYALSDAEGEALYPSSLIYDIKALFPFLEEVFVSWHPADREEEAVVCLAHPYRAFSFLLLSLRKVRQSGGMGLLWQEVYNWMLRHQPKLLLPLKEAAFYLQRREDSLPAEVAKLLYPFPLQASITQIEQFMACPFAHFIRFGLRASEREVAQLRPLEMGQFFHAALKIFFEKLKEGGLTSLQSPEEIKSQLVGVVEEIMAKLFPLLVAETVLATERQQYLAEKLKTILLASIDALLDHARYSKFQPVGLEVGFGLPGGWPSLVVREEEEVVLKLRGRIDRIDVAYAGERAFLRVVDYKLGDADINLGYLYYGLQLQLLAYLEAAMNIWEEVKKRQGDKKGRAERVEPAGMFYFRVHNPVVKESFPCRCKEEKIEEKRLASFRMRGIVLQDKEALELMHAGISGSGGRKGSHIIPAAFTREGEIRQNSNVLERGKFELLRSYLYLVLRQAVSRIKQGEITKVPYQYKKERACRNCSFHPICQFDRLMGDEYRVLPPLDKKEDKDKIWRCIKAAVEEAGSVGGRRGD